MWLLPLSLIILIGLRLSDFVLASPLRIRWERQELPLSLSREGEQIGLHDKLHDFAEQPTVGSTLVVTSTHASSPLPVARDAFEKSVPSSPTVQHDRQDEEPPRLNARQTVTPGYHSTATTTSTANPYPYPLLPTSYTFPSYSFPDYTYPTYSFPDYTYPTYSFPDYTYPTYSFPDYTYPTYSFPDYTYPTYSYPTPTFDSGGSNNGFGGGGSGSGNFDLPKMRKVNVKTIVGAVVGSVSGFLALIGGIWAGMKRRARKALRLKQQDQTREAEQRVPFMQASVGSASASIGHTPSMSHMSSAGVSMNNPQVPPPSVPYVPTQF